MAPVNDWPRWAKCFKFFPSITFLENMLLYLPFALLQYKDLNLISNFVEASSSNLEATWRWKIMKTFNAFSYSI